MEEMSHPYKTLAPAHRNRRQNRLVQSLSQMGLKLFDNGGGGFSDGEGDKIEIDQEFARRYEHNKKREDLQRLAELKKKGVIDSVSDSDWDESSSSEVEEDSQCGKKKYLKFFDALIRVRNQDPVLKNKEAKLFESESESYDKNDTKISTGDENKGRVKKDVKKEKQKPMYLKDVVSKQLIEEGPEFVDDEDTDNVGEKRVKSYSEEQEELRWAFLKAVEKQEGDGDGGELLREKIKSGGEDEDEDDEEDFGIGEKLDEYFGTDDKLDEDMIFLKDYFRNRMWLGKGDDKQETGDDEGLEIGVSEDEEEIERQEDYEREYNFRFEENAGDRVMGHSRVVEGSVRKKPNARKLQRERKEERMMQAEFERQEELKHLKNVKKKEMMEKLRKIRGAAGIGEDGACLLELDDLEEEFYPDVYDKKMKETFDEGYYEAEDIDPDFGSDEDEDGNDSEKPDFDKEDELLGLSKGWDDVNTVSDGFLSAREKILKQKVQSVDDHEPVGDEDDAISEDGKQKKNRKRKLREVEKAVREQLMEEYHKLEYEDTIGDLKTRFKYRAVKPKRYGLSASEVIMMDDKELNQYVSIKKLAPYREKEWEVPRNKTVQQRQKNKLELGASDVTRTHKHKMKSDVEKPSSATSSTLSEKPQIEMNVGTSNLSRRIKRRRRQAELKLSLLRLMAYGKIPLKQKGKKKP